MLFDSAKNKAQYMIFLFLRKAFRKVLSFLSIQNNKDERKPVAEIKRMIDDFPEPSNDYDRCYQHYQCVVWEMSKVTLFFLHCAGVVAIPFFLALYAFNRLLLKPSKSHSAILINSDDELGHVYDCSKLTPHELKEEFLDLKELRPGLFPPLLDGALGMDALKVWLSMALRHPLKGYLNFNILVYIMFANRLLLLYHPKALIFVRMETNYVSSMLTMFCERRGCELISIMHGSYLVNEKTAFARFSRMYIWDEHYRNIMLWGRSDATRYIVVKPENLRLNVAHTSDRSLCPYDICYYLTGSGAGYHENLEAIKNALVTLSESGLRIKIRPHPRWSDLGTIQTLFDDFDIEQASEKSLEDSVAETQWVMGMTSTVLLQAFYAGKTIVLDDVSNPVFFSKLEELQYIMLNKPHRLLSEFLRRNQQSQEEV